MRISYKILFLIVSIFIGFRAQAQNCMADFEYTVESEISSFTYHFFDKSVANSSIISYKWDFGDNSVSVKKDPEHQYLTEGDYLVSLTITTASGCTSTFYDSVSVQKIVQSNCMAYYTYISLSQSPSYTYAFTDHSVFTGGDSITSWHWNFGDGSTSAYQNPIHQFMATGNYNVSLTIYTSSGCNSTYSQIIQIFNGSSPCQASFSATQDTTGNPLKYHFHDYSVHSTNIISWKWKFDDGDSSNVQDPDHVFPFAGVYFVSLEIKTAGGCSDKISYPVQVSNPQPYNLWGRVYAGPYVIDKCIAYLYKVYNNNYYKPVDTVRLTSVNDTLGVYYFFQVPEGKHKVKVLLPDGSAYAEDYAPTYFGDKLTWKKGSTLNLFQNIPMANVNLNQVTKTSGNCCIKAKIQAVNTTVNNLGDIEILLFDAGGNLAGYTFSDSLGNITFGDLAKGSYYVCGEVTGLFSDMINVSFSNNSDTVNNLIINISKNSITGIFTDKNKQEIKFRAYPNPTEDFINLEFTANYSSERKIRIEIMDLQGRILMKNINVADANGRLPIRISNLISGIYLLKLTDIQSGSSSTIKFIRK